MLSTPGVGPLSPLGVDLHHFLRFCFLPLDRNAIMPSYSGKKDIRHFSRSQGFIAIHVFGHHYALIVNRYLL